MFKSVISAAVLIIFFLGTSYITQTNQEYFVALIGNEGFTGILVYIGLAIFTTVIAPLTSVPLIPLIVSVWGPVVAAIASIVGWLIGAMIAFSLSRRYGRKLVGRFVSDEKLAELESRVPVTNLFWSIVLLRTFLPVDVLSYALGLLSTVTWRTYFFATLLGIIPSAFILSYVGSLSFTYQIPLVILALVVVGFLNKRKT